MTEAGCTHLDQIKIESTEKRVCEDCIKTGNSWVCTCGCA